MTSDIEQRVNRARRADHWIYLDRSWAQRLGVKRPAGVYRYPWPRTASQTGSRKNGRERIRTGAQPGNARPAAAGLVDPQELPRRSA